jgi:hypothetical protein
LSPPKQRRAKTNADEVRFDSQSHRSLLPNTGIEYAALPVNVAFDPIPAGIRLGLFATPRTSSVRKAAAELCVGIVATMTAMTAPGVTESESSRMLCVDSQ